MLAISEILQHANQQGLEELSEPEMGYILAEIQYDLYAREPQMPNHVLTDRAEAWQKLRHHSTRTDEIRRFASQLTDLG
jgi:hypothetical protein